ncbi:MAG TPA: glycosyltransferase family 9 protein [Bryobacteraceae bacterium]|nr:glycosyltransferase family 9 protein [Bryobacteraceae bacterium]
MTSTSCSDIARELLARAIDGNPPAGLPRELLEDSCGQALFGILAEGLADRFEPALCDIYADLFARAIPGADPARYRRIRTPRPVGFEPRTVVVLSRVTLGADVAVTSVLLDAAKRRFPRAQIVFAGPSKNYELFAADPRIAHAPVSYRRGTLADRLAVRHDLESLAAPPDALVIDSDSRLTQLGLLPICSEDRYHLFESRAYGGASHASLPPLAAAWAEETFGIAGAKPYLALAGEPAHRGVIAVSLGVGENPGKRIADPFEENLLALLAESGAEICIDKGAGGEEADRVQRAVSRSGIRATFWEGSFAGFAAIIAAARLYAGYDSAGQHVAAAAGVPLISIFAGFPTLRMFHRWRPQGNVIRVDNPNPVEVLAHVRAVVSGSPRPTEDVCRPSRIESA